MTTPNSRAMGLGLFKPLSRPFVLWVYQNNLWRWLFSWYLPTAIVMLIVFLFSHHQIYGAFTIPTSLFWKNWLLSLLQPVDIDLFIAFSVLILSLAKRPSLGLMSFWEANLFAFSAIFYSAIGAFIWDFYLLETHRMASLTLPPRGADILLWFEPALLTFSCLGLYQLVILIGIKLDQNTNYLKLINKISFFAKK